MRYRLHSLGVLVISLGACNGFILGGASVTVHRRAAILRSEDIYTTRRSDASTVCRGTPNDDLWAKQLELASEMTASSSKSIKQEQKELFAKRRLSLIGDTAYLGFLVSCLLWTFLDNPFAAVSYAFGTTMGVAYAYGLGTCFSVPGPLVSPRPLVSCI